VTGATETETMTDETQNNPQETSAPAGQPEGGAATSPPDVSEQIAALAQEVRALREPSQPEESLSLADLLSYEDPNDLDPAQQQEQPVVQQSPQAQQPSPADAEAIFNEAIRERVTDAVYPYLEAMDREMRGQHLSRLSETTLPELKDPKVVAEVKQRLAPVAQRYDDPSLLSDPELVSQAVYAIRAQRAAAGEVPAEEARNQGASIETGSAAATNQDEDPITAFKREFLGGGTSQDAFT
jgi:hypothetical protein